MRIIKPLLLFGLLIPAISFGQDISNKEEVIFTVYEPTMTLKNMIYRINQDKECSGFEKKIHHVFFFMDENGKIKLISIDASSDVFITYLAIEVDGYFEYNNSQILISVRGNKNSNELKNYFQKTDKYLQLTFEKNLTDYCIYQYEMINNKAKLVKTIDSKNIYTH